jgi:hypothetical protein
MLWIETDTGTTVQNPDGSFSSKAQDIQRILPTASETGYAISEGLNAIKITTVDNTANIKEMQEYVMFCDDQIRSAYVSPDLVGNSGSYANAMANNQSSEVIINYITLDVIETMQKQLAERLIKFAFGEDENDDYGYFELVDHSLEDKATWAKIIESAREIGLLDMKKLEDVNLLRSKIGLPPLDKITDDMILGMQEQIGRGSNIGKMNEQIKKPYANGMKNKKEHDYNKK